LRSLSCIALLPDLIVLLLLLLLLLLRLGA
jgi:hypothetical protein